MFIVKIVAFAIIAKCFELAKADEKTLLFKDIRCEVSNKFVESNFTCHVNNQSPISTLTVVVTYKKPLKEMNVCIIEIQISFAEYHVKFVLRF